MTIALITGLTGQDGYYLAKHLLSEGAQVHGLALPSEMAWHELAGIVMHEGDLADEQSVASVVRSVVPDEIYNLGGISSVGYSWQEPVATGRITAIGPVHVMTAARNLQESIGREVRVLQASSAEIFGDSPDIPQTEMSPIRPTNPYGAAKAYAHLMTECFRKEGLFAASTILYNHESPRRPKQFVTRKITAGAAKIAFDGYGTLSLGNLCARRDWGWAPDYVDAMIRAVRHDEPDDFVIASGTSRTVAEFVEAAFARVGISDWQDYVNTDPAYYRPTDSRHQVGDATKARRILQWRPSVSFVQMVNAMVDNDVTLMRLERG